MTFCNGISCWWHRRQYLRIRSCSAPAETARTVDAALMNGRLDGTDRRIDDAHAKADKIQTGVEQALKTSSHA